VGYDGLVGYDCGLRLWATVSGDVQATVPGDGLSYACGLRLWATVVGYNGAYIDQNIYIYSWLHFWATVSGDCFGVRFWATTMPTCQTFH